MTRASQLGLSLDAKREEPLYRQIFDQIAERIQSGAFPAGFRLPPSRDLATSLGTHRNTVVRAYAALDEAGFLESTVGRGTFVAEREPSREHEIDETPVRSGLPWASLLSRAAEAPALQRVDRLMRMRGHKTQVINLARLQPPAELMPVDLFQRCLDHVVRAQGARALAYAPVPGVPRLREEIAKDLARQGVPADPDDILVTTGSQQAIDIIGRALLNPNDVVLVEGATYGGAIRAFSVAGGRLVPVPRDESGPELGHLRKLGAGSAKALYLMPNHRNPTGDCITGERRRELVDWSHEHGVALIEDDYGADLVLEGTPPPAMRALDAEVIYVGTYSKKLIPALRVGFIVCPRAIAEPLSALKHTMDLGTSPILQLALAEFLERGYMTAHLHRTLPEYRRRRDAMMEALAKHLPREVRYSKPERGITMWLDLPPGIDSEQVFDAASEEGVLVMPGTLTCVERSAQGGLRLTFGTEPPDRLKEGAKRLGKALKRVLDRKTGSPPMLGVA